LSGDSLMTNGFEGGVYSYGHQSRECSITSYATDWRCHYGVSHWTFRVHPDAKSFRCHIQNIETKNQFSYLWWRSKFLSMTSRAFVWTRRDRWIRIVVQNLLAVTRYELRGNKKNWENSMTTGLMDWLGWEINIPEGIIGISRKEFLEGTLWHLWHRYPRENEVKFFRSRDRGLAELVGVLCV